MLAAVSASISTPVCAVVFAVATIRMAFLSAMGLEIDRHFGRAAIGWQSGISSDVFLARHDAGDARGSEHVALGRRTVHDGRERFRRENDQASAVASRAVRSLSETSTMRAAPCSSRWVSLLMR